MAKTTTTKPTTATTPATKAVKPSKGEMPVGPIVRDAINKKAATKPSKKGPDFASILAKIEVMKRKLTEAQEELSLCSDPEDAEALLADAENLSDEVTDGIASIAAAL